MSKYVEKGTSEEHTYQLFSVLVHAGTGSNSGHYYVFIRPEMK